MHSRVSPKVNLHAHKLLPVVNRTNILLQIQDEERRKRRIIDSNNSFKTTFFGTMASKWSCIDGTFDKLCYDEEANNYSFEEQDDNVTAPRNTFAQRPTQKAPPPASSDKTNKHKLDEVQSDGSWFSWSSTSNKKQSSPALQRRSPKSSKAINNKDDESLETAETSNNGARQIKATVFMISGCEDRQTSADVGNIEQFTLPDPNGKSGGACTSALLNGTYSFRNRVRIQTSR